MISFFFYLTLGVLSSSLTLIPHISISKQRPVLFPSIHPYLFVSLALPLCGSGDKKSAMFTRLLFVEAAVFRGDLDGIWTTWTYVRVCFDGIGEWRQQQCDREKSIKSNIPLMWNHKSICNCTYYIIYNMYIMDTIFSQLCKLVLFLFYHYFNVKLW